MKNIILQYLNKDQGTAQVKIDLYEKAVKTVERFANNVGWEYELSRTPAFKNYTGHWDIFKVLEKNDYDEYDRILFLDADVFIMDTDDNVFDKYKRFSACREMDNPHPPSRPEFQRWGNEYFNSGIVLFTRKSIEKLRENCDPKEYRTKLRNVVPGRDQYALNLMAEQALGGYRRIKREDACFLREEHSKTTPVVHVAGRCRQIYNANPEYYDEKFGVK